MSDGIKTVLVAGYGLMGRGIVLSFARGEHDVKTEKGFYDWKGRDIDAMKATAAEKFGRILAIVQEP